MRRTNTVQLLVYSLLIFLFIIEWFVEELELLPFIVSWLPELLSAAVAAILLAELGAGRTLCLRPIYLVIFVAFILVLIAGWVTNSVSGGTIFGGVRFYLRYVPFFLLPIVYRFQEGQLNKIYVLLFVLLLAQIPITVVQKFVLDYPPDLVRGTANVGSVLSFLLIAGCGASLALYLSGRLSFTRFAVLLLLLYFPTTINETKSTLFYLPVCLVTTYLLIGKSAVNRHSPFVVFGSTGALLATFFLMYSLTLDAKWGAKDSDEGAGSLAAFFLDPEQGVLKYFFTGDAQYVDADVVLNRKKSVVFGQRFEPGIRESRIRRADSIALPFHLFKGDIVRGMIGLGAGNAGYVSVDAFNGRYFDVWSYINVDLSVTVYLLEVGILGFVVFLALIFVIFADSVRLARSGSKHSHIGAWWAGVCLMFLLSLFYKNFVAFNIASYLFWLFSGLVVSLSFKSSHGRVRRVVANEAPYPSEPPAQPLTR